MSMTRETAEGSDQANPHGLVVVSGGLFAVFLLALLGIEMTRAAGNVASIWLANIVALGIAFRLTGAMRIVSLAATACAIAAANLAFGDPLLLSLGLTAANMIEITVSLILLKWIGFRTEHINQWRGLGLFLLIAGIAGPVAGALIGSLLLNTLFAAPLMAVMQTWFLAGLVSVVILGPAAMSPNVWDNGQRPLALWEIVGWIGSTTAIVWLTTLTGAGFLIYFCPLLLVFAGVRVGLVASGIAGGLFAIYLNWGLVHGALGQGNPYHGNLLEAQFFLLSTMALSHAVTILWHQRRNIVRDLANTVAALQDTDEAIVFIDSDFRPISWNKAIERLLPDIGRVQAGGRADYREENLILFGQLRSGKELVDVPLQRPDGRGVMRDFLLNARPTRSDGMVDGAILRFRDVTREKALQRLNEERLHELEAFLNAIPDAAIGTDREGRVNIINQNMCEFYGRSREELLGRPIREIEPGGPDMQARIQRVIQGEVLSNYRVTKQDHMGRDVELLRSMVPIMDVNGRFMGIAGAQQDVTSLVELGLQVEQKELQIDELMSSVTDAIAIYDKNEILVRCNDAYNRDFGDGTESGLVGRSWTDISQGNIERGVFRIGEKSFEEWVHDRRDQRHPDPPSGYFEMGNGRWLLGRDYPTGDGGFVAIRQDITDLQKTQNELARSNSELEQFAFVASHDLQEPLRKISAFGNILSDEHGDRLDGDAASYLGFMIAGANRMQSLINDLLAFSRVARDSSDRDFYDLSVIARSAMGNLAILTNERNAKIRIGELGTAYVKESEMMRVFQNLITNSIKYARDGVTPEISVMAETGDPKWLVIRITDNGQGIPERFYDDIFQPFKRLHGQSKVGGTGMGLAIVRKIIENLGGSIGVTSEVGQGSVFTIRLPSE